MSSQTFASLQDCVGRINKGRQSSQHVADLPLSPRARRKLRRSSSAGAHEVDVVGAVDNRNSVKAQVSNAVWKSGQRLLYGGACLREHRSYERTGHRTLIRSLNCAAARNSCRYFAAIEKAGGCHRRGVVKEVWRANFRNLSKVKHLRIRPVAAYDDATGGIVPYHANFAD